MWRTHLYVPRRHSLSTPGRALAALPCRHECRHGTHECVRHGAPDMILRNMRGLVWIAIAAMGIPAQGANAVLVELFTSEGCSSCPPADVLLAKLVREQPIAGAQVIALGEHVDYWDHQGWRDQFSSGEFTQRQQRYARSLLDNGPYTPQMVVDGVTGFVGNDDRRALSEIAKAARQQKVAVGITTGDGQVSVKVEGVRHAAEVLLAITEDNLLSNVSKGENAGRKLRHVAVVRVLRGLGKAKPGVIFAGETKVAVEKNWKIEDLCVVAFVQESSSRRVVGAASVPLRP